MADSGSTPVMPPTHVATPEETANAERLLQAKMAELNGQKTPALPIVSPDAVRSLKEIADAKAS